LLSKTTAIPSLRDTCVEVLVGDALSSELCEINLNGWRAMSRDLFAVYPASRQLSAKVRAAIDFALQRGSTHG
jgi:hypothetical protein